MNYGLKKTSLLSGFPVVMCDMKMGFSVVFCILFADVIKCFRENPLMALTTSFNFSAGSCPSVMPPR